MLAVFIWCLVFYGTAGGASTTATTSNVNTSLSPLVATSNINSSPSATDTTPNINSSPPPPPITTTTTTRPTIRASSTKSRTTMATATNSGRTKPTSTPSDGKHTFCYQCSATSADEPCVTDTGGMANISTRDIYIKDCTDSNPEWHLCMIQTVEAAGKLIFYHRDCHDGRYFPKPYDSDRFHNISANNMTTCDMVADKIVCYRPCQGNLCNGPETYVNETNYCLLYRDNPNENVTLPPGVECGSLGHHFRIEKVALLVMSVMAAVLFGNVIHLPVNKKG